VALEPRAGSRWPLKAWRGYDELAALLRAGGAEPFFLRRRGDLREYLFDISRCAVLVSGDTLAMHAALALRRKAVAVFNCTSPWEIYGYGRLRELRHPDLAENFYSTRPQGLDFSHIPAAKVFRAVMASLRERP
jgi:heptosyltransferase-2